MKNVKNFILAQLHEYFFENIQHKPLNDKIIKSSQPISSNIKWNATGSSRASDQKFGKLANC